MKKFLTTFIYTSLAILSLGYLFRLMHWTNADVMLQAGFWMHIASYIGYSFVVTIKDNRLIYPLGVLVLLFVIQMFNIEIGYQTSFVGFFVLFIVYIGFHLITPNYLVAGDPKPIRIAGIIALITFAIASIFKIMHWAGADMLLISSVSTIAFVLMLQGWLKGRTV
ncbi:MAG: hypothetical protein RLZZ337_2035 [Bacteroidota bacterium]|jgi:hypothetical protein